MAAKKSPAIGIDLGTTYSCVAVLQYGTIDIVANDQGNRTTPSYVSYTEQGRLIGEAAKLQVTLTPENTVYDVKRLIGRRFGEVDKDDLMHLGYNVTNDGGIPKIEVSFVILKIIT